MPKCTLKLLVLFALLLCATHGFAQIPTAELEDALKDLSHLTPAQKKEALNMVGVPDTSSFSFAKVIAWVVFGGVGFIAFIFGKKRKEFKPLLVGIALMAYPYFFTHTFWLYAVGIGLCAFLYFYRE